MKPKPIKSVDYARDIADEIVVGFDPEKLAAMGLVSAQKMVDTVLTRLGELGATVLKRFIAETSDEKFYFALAVIRPSGPELTLADLQRSDDRAFEDVSFERNVPIAMAGVALPPWQRQWALDIVEASEPWRVTPPAGSRTVVAIVDSGLRLADGSVHEDLGAVAPASDCQLPWFYPDNIDADGHGTALAGTIAAIPGNAKGVDSPVPATWNITLLPVKFFSPLVSPNAADAAIAIAHAVDKGAKVINASWHVSPGDKVLRVLKLAFLLATLKDRLIVSAAGNAGTDNEVYPIFPANFGSDPAFRRVSVLTVMATDRDDAKATFSNYGRTIVDLAAPGQRVATLPRYPVGQRPLYPYYYSGTSAAAALVSSGAALVFALNPTWKARNVIEHLTASADVVERLKLSCVGGKRLNLRRAVYGPLQITAPTGDDTLAVGARTDITWRNEYANPRFRKVRIELSLDDGATWPVTLVVSTDNNGQYAWTPLANQVTASARIRITPTAGNFPAQSDAFRVVN